MRYVKGQSLIEVVVAVGAMSLLLVALLTTVALSVKNSRIAKDRNQAVALASEGMELMRAYRDYDWDLFYGEISVDDYDLPVNWVVENGLSVDCSEDEFLIRNFYRRCVLLTVVDIDSLDVRVIVDWQEGEKIHQVVQQTRLSKWER